MLFNRFLGAFIPFLGALFRFASLRPQAIALAPLARLGLDELRFTAKARISFLTLYSVILTFVFLFAFSYIAYAEELPHGQVIPKVVCKTNEQHSYALYLPSNYTHEKKWPIIYAFEPGARGPVPVERFKEAAEKFGYIIVASNNSRNGMNSDEINSIISSMLSDTDKRFSIDQNRVYLTGFSGGARLALQLAIAGKGAFAGVIICGAGFSPSMQPTKDLPFVIFGATGIEDFNYPEMMLLDETLSKLGLTHRIVTFEGAHEWASSAVCLKAVEWLELQAMRANRRMKDEAWMDKLWQSEIEQARSHETNGKLYEAYLVYNALAQDFKGLRRDTTEVEKKIFGLTENKAVKQGLKDVKEEIGKQETLVNQLISFGPRITNADSSERTLIMQELRRFVSDVRKQAQAAEDNSQRRVARRSLRAASAYYYETSAHQFLPQKKYDTAALYIEIFTELNPNNTFGFVELARIYALSRQKKQAIQALQKAVEKGFDDLMRLEDKDFDSLRGESDWQKLIETVKQKRLTKEG